MKPPSAKPEPVPRHSPDSAARPKTHSLSAKLRLAEQKKYRHLRGRAVLWVVSIDGDVVAAERPAGDARKPTREIHNTALIVSLNFFLGKNQRADGIAHRRGEVVRRAGIGVRDVAPSADLIP